LFQAQQESDMRKRMIDQQKKVVAEVEHHWLNLEVLAEAELSSEDEAHPFEAALIAGGGGWQAAEAGEQTLRLLFDQPQQIRLIRLIFQEGQHERTQEIILRWSAGEDSFHDIARQQYNFSAPDSIRQLENYHVELQNVTILELSITPDISGGSARATLAEWRIA